MEKGMMTVFAVPNGAVILETAARLSVFVKAQLTKFPLFSYLDPLFQGQFLEFVTESGAMICPIATAARLSAWELTVAPLQSLRLIRRLFDSHVCVQETFVLIIPLFLLSVPVGTSFCCTVHIKGDFRCFRYYSGQEIRKRAQRNCILLALIPYPF